MIIIYNKNTGEIIASFPETYKLDKNIEVTNNGLDSTNFSQKVLSAKGSLSFENPRDKNNIYDYFVKDNKLTKKIK